MVEISVNSSPSMNIRKRGEKKYINLREAARISGYASDYIGYLVRNKKIKGKRVDTNVSWRITSEELIKYGIKTKNLEGRDSSLLKKKYLSLREAATLSGYTPDYIGYLIRKGKIKGKAVSLGKAWFTTTQAIAEYQAKKKRKKKLSKYPGVQRVFWYTELANTFLRAPRFALPIFIFLLIGFSALAIYTTSSKEVKIEIFPTVWQGEWQNGQNALSRELSAEVTLAEFNSENSAFLNVEEIIFPTPPVREEIPPEENILPEEEELLIEEEQPPPEEQPQEEIPEQPPIEESTEEEPLGEAFQEEEIPEEELSEEPSQEESLPASEESQPEEQTEEQNHPQEEAPQSFLEKFFSWFSFLPWASAQEIEPGDTNDTEQVSEIGQETGEPADEGVEGQGDEGVEEQVNEEEIPELSISDEEPQLEEPAEEPAEEPVEESVEEPAEEIPPEEIPVEEEMSPEETLSPEEIILPTVDGELPEETGAEDKSLQEPEGKEEFEEEVVTVFLNQSSITYSGFVLPKEMDSASSPQEGILKGARVGFSFASQGQEGEDDEVLVDWSLDGENWDNLVVLQQNQEYSNVLNGEYFYFNLPPDFNWENLEQLKIKFTALTNNPGGEGLPIYLDSIWLEVTYEEEKKIEEPEEPEIILLTPQKDFKGNEEPEFQFRYKKINDGLLASVGEALGTLNYWENINTTVRVMNLEGETLDISPFVFFENDGEFLVEVRKPQEFRPGLYKIILKIEEEGNVQEFEQDFSWGVLAINTNKSIYLPGEQAYIQMAALRDDGHTICDANLVLTITAPNEETTNPTIQRSGECGRNNVTDKPDYFAYYQVGETGVYQTKLTNLDNGYEITDSFEVRDSVSFDVERIGPTRIYPQAEYQMTLRIKANQDFVGEVREYVPDSFVIQPQITWQVDWKAGEIHELKYTFDAPDISPYLYLLGPLEIGTFQEARQWQIAADAPWTLVGQTTAEIAYGTSDDVTLPGPPQEDDIVIVGLGSDYNSGQCIINTTGYTELYNDGSGGVPVAVLAYKIMGATPDTLVNVQKDGTMRNMAVVIQVWRGVDTTTPIDATPTTASSSTGMPNSPSYTPVTDGALVFTVGFLDDDNCTTVTAPTTPSPGFSNLTYGSADTDGNGITVMMASLEQATAGTIDPGIFTGTGSTDDEWHAVTFALRPAAPTYTLTQNDWRWYENADNVQPGTAKANENTAITGVSPAEVLRIRINLTVADDNMAADDKAFKLQYGQGTDCTAIGTWNDVGAIDSGTIWRGYNNSTPTDGATIGVSDYLLSTSDVAESYEEENNSVNNPRAINNGQDGEWDWVVQENGAAANTSYCFRMVESDGTALDGYNTDSYPKLTTGGPYVKQLHYRWRNDDGGE